MTKKQERQMEVAEMKMLRFSLGVTRKDRLRNESVRGKLKVEEFGGILRETRLRWWGHLQRREQSYVGNRVREMRVGSRERETKKEMA